MFSFVLYVHQQLQGNSVMASCFWGAVKVIHRMGAVMGKVLSPQVWCLVNKITMNKDKEPYLKCQQNTRVLMLCCL